MSIGETSSAAPEPPARPGHARAGRARSGLGAWLGWAAATAAASAGYALAVGDSRAFTVRAEVLTAAGCAGGCLLLLRRHILAHRGNVPLPAPSRRSRIPGWRDRVVWGALGGAILGYELVALAGSPRSLHPTLSSLADGAGATSLGRAALALGWMALYAVVVR